MAWWCCSLYSNWHSLMWKIWRLDSGVMLLVLDMNILSASRCLHSLRSMYQGLLWYLGVLSEGIWTEVEPTQQVLPCCPQDQSTASTTLTLQQPLQWVNACSCQDVPIVRLPQLLGAQGLLDNNFYSSGKDAQMVCPQTWKHMGCVYASQPSSCLAIIHRQDDVIAFRLTM